MAAKGTVAKENITKQILSIFPNSFVYGKEIRIPFSEQGDEVQIKVTLTTAKTPVSPSEEDVFNSEEAKNTTTSAELNWGDSSPTTIQKQIAEPTEEEKQRVEDLIKGLGL